MLTVWMQSDVMSLYKSTRRVAPTIYPYGRKPVAIPFVIRVFSPVVEQPEEIYSYGESLQATSWVQRREEYIRGTNMVPNPRRMVTQDDDLWEVWCERDLVKSTWRANSSNVGLICRCNHMLPLSPYSAKKTPPVTMRCSTAPFTSNR